MATGTHRVLAERAAAGDGIRVPDDTPSTPSANPVSQLVQREVSKLFPGDAPACDAFLCAWGRGDAGRPAMVWRDAPPDADAGIARSTAPDWCPPWAWCLAPGAKAGQHPGHAAGRFYLLDLSSVWESLPLAGWAGTPPRRMLDLCASPGGKSVLAWKWLRPDLIVANEVVRARLGPLRHNLARLRIPAAFTQAMSVADWSRAAPAAFDLVLLDAPCSGQSLPARGVANPGCFHPAVVNGNAGRQKSLLGRAAGCVAPGGHLLYTTCTFSREENEKVVEAFLRRYDGWEAVACPALERWRSVHCPHPCYRLFPHHGAGAGGFTCLLRLAGDPGGLPALDPDLLAWPVGDSGGR